MSKVEKEKLDEIKARNPGGVYEGAVSFSDSDDVLHDVVFVYRKPVTADIEAHTKASQRNPIVANLNLLQSLIVHPDPAAIVEEIREYPAAYGRFIDEAISPFFGANVTVRSRKL
jgi:hypothetical protein